MIEEDRYGENWTSSTDKPTKERRYYNSADQKYTDFLVDTATILKILSIIGLAVWLLWGCEKRDTLRDYDYLPNQPYTLEINVIPMDDAKVNMTNLILEVNADYLNRYGIAAEFTLQPPQDLEDDILGKETFGIGRIFLPTEKRDATNKLNLWVLPNQNVMSGVAGYAVTRHNMVVRERSLYGTTVTHEIGHLLGLGHVKLSLNVMQTVGNSDQRADPRNFVPQQIDTMTTRLADKILLSEIESIIIN